MGRAGDHRGGDFRQERKADRLRRAEKIRDFQIALRAEIRSELLNLTSHDIDSLLEDVKGRYSDDPGFVVSVPRVTKHIVFDAIVGEIHILPEQVIDPVVLYARQREAVESIAEDMRDPVFKELSRDRQIAMYEDYLRMWKTWRDFATDAEAALSTASASIAGSRSSRLAFDRLDRR